VGMVHLLQGEHFIVPMLTCGSHQLGRCVCKIVETLTFPDYNWEMRMACMLEVIAHMRCSFCMFDANR